MLANLDNEVHFKRVFTDVEVFCAFVKDVIGIDMQITKVETEKVIDSKVSAIKFRMDLFAESTDHRSIVEIQKIDYDYSYDRFAHYFIGNLIDMQRSSKDYGFDKEVYIIVVVTSAYRISEKNGKAIKDDVLITDINPRNLKGEVRDMYNHKMVILNTTNWTTETPENISDWMKLITESMKNPDKPQINTNKPAIVKAAKLAEINRTSPQQLAEAKIQEMRKVTVAVIENDALKKGEEAGMKKGEEIGSKKAKEDGIKKLLAFGILSKEQIAATFEVTVEYVSLIERDTII